MPATGRARAALAQVVELVGAHGGLGPAEAEATVARWTREKRYLQDIWS